MIPSQDTNNAIKFTIDFICLQCSSVPLINLSTTKHDSLKIKCKCGFSKILKIFDYLEIMKKKKSIPNEINQNKCIIHIDQEYKYFCFDCTTHLCSNCQKNINEHQFHRMVNLQKYLEDCNIPKIQANIINANEYLNTYYNEIKKYIYLNFQDISIKKLFDSNLIENKAILLMVENLLNILQQNKRNYYKIRNLYINSNFVFETINLGNTDYSLLSQFLHENYIVKKLIKEDDYFFTLSKIIDIDSNPSVKILNDKLVVGFENSEIRIYNLKTFDCEFSIQDYQPLTSSFSSLGNDRLIFSTDSEVHIIRIGNKSYLSEHIYQFNQILTIVTITQLSKNRVGFSLEEGGIVIYQSNPPYNYIASFKNETFWKFESLIIELNRKNILIKTDTSELQVINLENYQIEKKATFELISFVTISEYNFNKIIVGEYKYVAIVNTDTLQIETIINNINCCNINMMIHLRNDEWLCSNQIGQKFLLKKKLEYLNLKLGFNEGNTISLVKINDQMFIEVIETKYLKIWSVN